MNFTAVEECDFSVVQSEYLNVIHFDFHTYILVLHTNFMQNSHIEILLYIPLRINHACVKGDKKDRDSEVCISCSETNQAGRQFPHLSLNRKSS